MINTVRSLQRIAQPLIQRKQIMTTQDELQWIVEELYFQHLQYLDAAKSSAKDLSLPSSEIKICHYLF